MLNIDSQTSSQSEIYSFIPNISQKNITQHWFDRAQSALKRYSKNMRVRKWIISIEMISTVKTLPELEINQINLVILI